MKIILLLTFVQIALSAFCINGEYNFQCYTNQQGYNYTVRSFSNVIVLNNEELIIKNIKDIEIGDLVKSHSDYFTVVTEKYKTRIANPQMYYHSEMDYDYANYLSYEIIDSYYTGGNLAMKTFTDEKPYIFNSTYYYEGHNYNNEYQFGVQEYNIIDSPIIVLTNGSYWGENCSFVHYYPRGTNIINMASIMNIVNGISIVCNICGNPTITISECDAIGLKTESGYITVNGIFFKLD